MPNIVEARIQLQNFIAEMAGNRSHCDDTGIARQILQDLDRRGEATGSHRARLARWCHTNGSLYRRGVPIARAISLALYDRVLPSEDQLTK